MSKTSTRFRQYNLYYLSRKEWLRRSFKKWITASSSEPDSASNLRTDMRRRLVYESPQVNHQRFEEKIEGIQKRGNKLFKRIFFLNHSKISEIYIYIFFNRLFAFISRKALRNLIDEKRFARGKPYCVTQSHAQDRIKGPFFLNFFFFFFFRRWRGFDGGGVGGEWGGGGGAQSTQAKQYHVC